MDTDISVSCSSKVTEKKESHPNEQAPYLGGFSKDTNWSLTASWTLARKTPNLFENPNFQMFGIWKFSSVWVWSAPSQMGSWNGWQKQSEQIGLKGCKWGVLIAPHVLPTGTFIQGSQRLQPPFPSSPLVSPSCWHTVANQESSLPCEASGRMQTALAGVIHAGHF